MSSLPRELDELVQRRARDLTDELLAEMAATRERLERAAEELDELEHDPYLSDCACATCAARKPRRARRRRRGSY